VIGVVVLGPESSGTRYTESLLQAANWNAEDRLIRRSLPYDTAFVPLAAIMAELDCNDTRVVLTSRRADVLALSQVAHGHAPNWEDALVQVRRAYTWAIGECTRLAVPFLLTSYEAFADPRYRMWVCDWAWDTSDHDAALAHGYQDGNEKYL
jgi:hypothetical protein